MTFFSVVLIIFLIIDPMGNVAIFHNLLEEYSPKHRVWIVIREMLIALFTMTLFYFIGDYLLEFLSISPTAIRLSSGMILFIAAIKILFPTMGEFRASYRTHKEPFIIPLAIPLVAGPSLLATVMLFAHYDAIGGFVFQAMIVGWFCALLIFLYAAKIHRLLGDNGLVACERVMGMVLVLLAIQRFLEGIKLFIGTLAT